MNTYTAGSVVTVATYAGAIASPTGGFRDRNGTLADPDIVRLKYRTPDATITTVQYPATPIARDATGLYHADLDTTGKPGRWTYEWYSPSGDPVQAIAVNSFDVIPALL